MIDVVFLLLVFFMLAARFGQDLSLPLSAAGAEVTADAAPRLVTLTGETLALNGVAMALPEVARDLSGSDQDKTVFLLPRGETSLQRMVDVIDALKAAGMTSIVVVNEP